MRSVVTFAVRWLAAWYGLDFEFDKRITENFGFAFADGYLVPEQARQANRELVAMMRIVVLAALAMPLAAPPAWAHALLERASPPVGSKLPTPPSQLVLTFTEGVEPLFSTIELRNAQNTPVPLGKPATAANDKRQLVIQLPRLADGTYTVIWHATSVDTHKTAGSFHFPVK